MSVEQEVERTFKNFLKSPHVVGQLTMYLIFTPMFSAIAASLEIFIFLTVLIFIELFISWRVWKNGADFEIQQRVLGFFLIFNIELHGVMPFFIFSFGTIFFYISLAIYLLLLVLLFTKTKVIAEAIHSPSESFIGKACFFTAGLIVVAILILLITMPNDNRPTGGFIVRLLGDNIREFYLKSAFYLMGLLMTFVLPVFFYPVQSTFEEHPTGRKKLSRAKRKALKARNVKTDKNAH